MNKSWWKITSILILVYVFIAGMLGPLKPGIIRVDPQTVSTGQELVLQVEGYNSHYLEAGDAIRAWLKLDDERALGATSVQSKSETQLEAVFAIPQYLPVDKRSQDFVLVVGLSALTAFWTAMVGWRIAIWAPEAASGPAHSALRSTNSTHPLPSRSAAAL